jgi:hypothetical protein
MTAPGAFVRNQERAALFVRAIQLSIGKMVVLAES